MMTKITKVGTVLDLLSSLKVNNTNEGVNDNVLLGKAKVGVLIGLGYLGKQ